MTFQIHVSEIEGHLLTGWQPDQIDTLAIVGIVIGPIWGNYDALTVSERTTTTWVT